MRYLLQTSLSRLTFAVWFRRATSHTAALSEGLVLKHFYNSIFSPSSSQREISRFLIATWMSGPPESEAKQLLTRMLPSGLLEFLKYERINEQHKQNLDDLENEFYAQVYATGAHTPAEISSAKAKRKFSAVQQEAEARADGSFENFRVMFHMITRDHELADLIWNEKTRLELRNALEAEMHAFDRELSLRGPNTLAWNYQQFAVQYESLKLQVRVGSIYLRHYVEAGDAFIRTLRNPAPEVFFEKLLRRVLGHVHRDAAMSSLCVKCLKRLYAVCKDMIGPFDDMMILIRLLDSVHDIELQHALVDLLELMCRDDANVQQLLDPEFVSIMCQLASYAHLNPDQIGNLLHRQTHQLLITAGDDAEMKVWPSCTHCCQVWAHQS